MMNGYRDGLFVHFLVLGLFAVLTADDARRAIAEAGFKLLIPIGF